MLSIFRGGAVSQVLVGGIAFSIILVFALEFRAGKNGPTASLKKECAVEIKGSCVDPKEYYASFGLIVPRGVNPKAARQLSLHKKVLDGLVERELLVADAARLGISVSESEVEEELFNGRAHVSVPVEDSEKLSYQLGLCRRSEERPGCEAGTDMMVRELHVKRTANEPFDYAVYEREVRILANRGPKEFKEMQQRELTAARVRALIRQPVRVSESEAFELFQQERTTAVLRSVILQRDWFAKYVSDLSEDQLNKWIGENSAAIEQSLAADKGNFSAGCSPAREIALEVGPGANDTDRAELRKRLELPRQRITSGEAFATVAREASEGQTAFLGGELGCIGAGYGLGNEELAKAASALKPGELSAIIETPRGLHLLEVDPKLDAGAIEAASKRFIARKLAMISIADGKLKTFGEELIRRAQAGAKLEDALDAQLSVTLPAPASVDRKTGGGVPALAASDRPKLEISAPFTLSGNPVPQVTPKEPLAAHAFELKAPGEMWPTPIATDDGSVVIQLKEKNLAKRADFDKNKQAILGPLTSAKAADALSRYVAALRHKLGDKLKIDPRFSEEQKSPGRDDEE